jgi:hypothetical protein
MDIFIFFNDFQSSEIMWNLVGWLKRNLFVKYKEKIK